MRTQICYFCPKEKWGARVFFGITQKKNSGQIEGTVSCVHEKFPLIGEKRISKRMPVGGVRN